MAGFADRTGLTTGTGPPHRYLWTDAFAVCNYLEIYRQTDTKSHLDTVLALVDQVHLSLGRYSDSDSRSGWISGLDGQEGALHPTRGGLRIGKKMMERKADERFDEHLEWERDGQYFHYLTKWMHALDCVARVTEEPRYNRWALELAKKARAGFTYTAPDGEKRMYWKMSIDLSYPLVASMGQHDPLDGLITYMQLQTTAKAFANTPSQLNLDTEITDFRTMCEGTRWTTDDALGIGGLLSDAFRLVQLIIETDLRDSNRLASLLADAQVGLEVYAREGPLDHPANYRLAFRELGLSIGIHAIAKMRAMVEQHPERFSNLRELVARLSVLTRFERLSGIIDRFWRQPDHQQSDTWCEHRDINSVMLATSLAPDGYLKLRK